MLESYGKFLKNYFVFKGRTTRKDFWLAKLMNYIISILWIIYFILVTNNGEEENVIVAIMLFGMWCIAIIIPTISMTIRRLHDIGKSGWWYLIKFIPIVGSIILLIFECMPSVTNNISEENKTSIFLIVLFSIICSIILILNVYILLKLDIDRITNYKDKDNNVLNNVDNGLQKKEEANEVPIEYKEEQTQEKSDSSSNSTIFDEWPELKTKRVINATPVYYCTSPSVLSGTKCLYTTSISAMEKYSCDYGMLIGTQCRVDRHVSITYTTTAKAECSNYANTGMYYSCLCSHSGGPATNGSCVKTVTTYEDAKKTYYCGVGLTLSGNQCLSTIETNALIKYTCPTGYYLFGISSCKEY